MQGTTRYEPAPANPDYSDVVALPSRPPDLKVPYGDYADQFSLLWLPDGEYVATKPTIALIHGGCWLQAYDINHTAALATALAQSGYPVWNIEYRRAEEDHSTWPSSLEDLRLGLTAINQLTNTSVEPHEVVILGHSAGGHLALLLASEADQLFPGGRPELCVVGLAAITDITRYAAGENSCQQAAKVFMGGSPAEMPEAYAAANPANSVFSIPVTLLHGEADQIVPRDQFEGLPGNSVNRVLEPGAGHFDWIHPGTDAFQTLLRVLEQCHVKRSAG